MGQLLKHDSDGGSYVQLGIDRTVGYRLDVGSTATIAPNPPAHDGICRGTRCAVLRFSRRAIGSRGDWDPMGRPSKRGFLERAREHLQKIVMCLVQPQAPYCSNSKLDIGLRRILEARFRRYESSDYRSLSSRLGWNDLETSGLVLAA